MMIDAIEKYGMASALVGYAIVCAIASFDLVIITGCVAWINDFTEWMGKNGS